MGHRRCPLEDLVVTPEFWNGKRVLVTGHTGFKGAWLSLWLTQMGAKVIGFSRPPEGDPNLWQLLNLGDVTDLTGDVCDADAVEALLRAEKPDVVLHLAAQSLVRRSYRMPLDTIATNVMGVAVLLDAIARTDTVQACVIVTSDKCYQNLELDRAYTEMDPMGGHDPYSASKGAAELITASLRNSYFKPTVENGASCAIASARAGNVIGGGDWSEDRLIPDIVRGCLGPEGSVLIRSPNSIRPWQHVMEPLRGYMMLAERLCTEGHSFAEGWNFGPDPTDARPVIDVADAIVSALGRGQIEVAKTAPDLHEAKLLQLDSTKAQRLGWAPNLNFQETVDLTAAWYGDWVKGRDVHDLCVEQVNMYMNKCGDQL